MKQDQEIKRLKDHVIVDYVHWISCFDELCPEREMITYHSERRMLFAQECHRAGWTVDDDGKTWCPDCFRKRFGAKNRHKEE
jgi:hypothetical protein